MSDFDGTSYSTSADGSTSFASLAVTVLLIIDLWIIFKKAGLPGWGAIIPIYNIYLVIKVARQSGWWLFLLLIPIVNIIVSLILAFDLARAFGRSGLFGFFLLWLLPPIGLSIIAFGGSRYQATEFPDSWNRPAELS